MAASASCCTPPALMVFTQANKQTLKQRMRAKLQLHAINCATAAGGAAGGVACACTHPEVLSIDDSASGPQAVAPATTAQSSTVHLRSTYRPVVCSTGRPKSV
jgi:hypothetical protein